MERFARHNQLCQLNLCMRISKISKFALRGTSILCGFFMWTFSSAAGLSAPDTARNEIRATLQSWTKDFNAGNAFRVCALFAPDLISNYQGQPAGDYQSICAQLRASLNDSVKSYHYSLRIEEIIVCGELAIARLRWRLRVSQKSVRGENLIDETSLDIFRRQPDGSWKITRFNAYPSSAKS
jgi:ketosteroid isomerase-like protein